MMIDPIITTFHHHHHHHSRRLFQRRQRRRLCYMFFILMVGALLLSVTIRSSNAATFLLPHHGRNVCHSASSVGHIVAIMPSSSRQNNNNNIYARFVSSTSSSSSKPDAAAPPPNPPPQPPPPCFYKIGGGPSNNQWKQRIQLQDLHVGQELQVADICQELLTGHRTGPKLYCEVGVGRYSYISKKGKWHMVFAMLRLPRNEKLSVTTKRVARLRKKCKQQQVAMGRSGGKSSGSSRSGFPVYVSRIRIENGQLEVCLTREEALAMNTDSISNSLSSSSSENSIPMSSLQVGQELTGRVVRVEPYGALIDLDNINRPGLLHIQKVADLYGTYIDKANGLQKQAGLQRGTRLQVQVAAEVKQKRLSLDFTEKTKQMAEMERQKQQQQQQQQQQSKTISRSNRSSQEMKKKESNITTNKRSESTSSSTTVYDTMSEDEMAAWAAYAEQQQQSSSSLPNGSDSQDDDDDDDDDDDYDEDRDIEDALGLGSY